MNTIRIQQMNQPGKDSQTFRAYGIDNKPLGVSASTMELSAKTEANVGPWIGTWLQKGWGERSGTTQFIKTAKFGK